MQQMDVRGAGGVRLAVRVHEGSGAGAPDLLLHHGLASSQRIWDLMLPRLRRRFRVVTYDARGHGLSAKPASGYGLADVVADARAVARAAGARRSIVVGHSWGAAVALELAARHPGDVRGAVLVDGGFNTLHGTMSWPEARRQLAPPALDGMPVEEFRRRIAGFLDDALDVTPDIEDIVLSVMRVDRNGRIHPRLARRNHLRILRSLWLHEPDAAFARLTVPALAVFARGTDPDRDARKRDAAARAKARGAPLTVAWLTGIHDLPVQRPVDLARHIERFATETVR